MNISEFNINAEFIACNHITTNELNPLVEKPYHTKASIFALCTKGVLKTIINHTQFRVEANALLVIPPETFVQLLHTSEDAEIYVAMFSQQLIQSAGAGKLMMDICFDKIRDYKQRKSISVPQSFRQYHLCI